MRGWGRRRHLKYEHSATCKKCQVRAEANRLSIRVHEWPLPSETNEVKAAVFELRVPDAVYWWREITYQLLVDIFTSEFKTLNRPAERYKLAEFKDYDKWRVTRRSCRVQLASATVSFSIFILWNLRTPLVLYTYKGFHFDIQKP